MLKEIFYHNISPSNIMFIRNRVYNQDEIKYKRKIFSPRKPRNCCFCDEHFYSEDLNGIIELDDGIFFVCKYCFESIFIVCSECDTIISDSLHNRQTINNRNYCTSCAEKYFWYCDYCETYHGVEDTCYAKYILSYEHKPKPIWHTINEIPSKTELIGFELEVEKDDLIGKEIKDISNLSSGNLFYCKYDNSIENGFEVVTHPFSFKWYLNNKAILKKMLTILKTTGCEAYNRTNTGMHIHVSNMHLKTFHMWKMLEFIRLHERYIWKISQRKNYSHFEEYAKFNHLTFYDDEGDPIEDEHIKDQSKKKGNYERHSAINFQNSNTVEFRLFQGNIKASSLFKNIEFVHSFYNWCKDNDKNKTLSLEQYNLFIKNNAVKKEKVVNRKKYISVGKYYNLWQFLINNKIVNEKGNLCV